MAKYPRLLPLIAVAIGGVVAVRAIGVAPGLFDGAKAWAEEAVAAAPAGDPGAAKPAPAVCALTPEQLAQQAGLSPAELRVLQSLKDRRAQLDMRDNDFATQLPLMAAAEEKLDAKTQALNSLKAELQALLGQVGEREQAEVNRLVQVYSAMRPREAAAVFATLDDKVRLPVAAAMRPRTLAAIMAQMPAPAAKELTEKMARRFEAQQQAARLATAATPDPAPAATDAAAPAASTPPAAQPAAAAARPAARQAPRRPAPRPAANRPAANRPAASAPSPAAAAPAAPQSYQADTPAQPRQSVN
ncbi:hypothetical protein ASG17_12400 [Brevundimonas sp. Leaf363]|uniref:MotE family protein n=1 Tax=Brevundimonas sp. Leaf363 TaxID=1736353 RepID=UPI0006F495EF|nr:hypothetical protein [Brevundimonas sp. Leaf363]KQS54424.1 hypothetical protein ASG17_12400 [Brevundimonas sp. Leaf363]